METPGSSEDNTLYTDTDIPVYLKLVMQSDEESPDFEAITEYLSSRDFRVEPLHSDAVVELLNLFSDDVSADNSKNGTVKVWAPARNDQLTEVSERLSNWGYEIINVGRVNRTIGAVPVIQFDAVRSPSPVTQLKKIGELVDTPREGLLLYLTYLYSNDKDQSNDERSVAQKWETLFRGPPEAIAEEIVETKQKITDIGEIPGTQDYIEQHGGVSISTNKK